MTAKKRNAMRLANKLSIGYCSNPTCRSVHFELRDKSGNVFAMAVLPVESVGAIVAELDEVEAYLVGVKPSCLN